MSLRPPPGPRPRPQRGFSLIELMLVVAIVSILAAIVAPSLSALGKRGALRSDAHAVANAIAAARELAISQGRCVLVGVNTNTPRLLQVELLDGINCENAVTLSESGTDIGMSGSGVTETDIPQLQVEIPEGDRVTMSTVFAPANDMLVWRPNGHMRGETTEFGTSFSSGVVDVNDNFYRLRLTCSQLPAANQNIDVIVLENGLICVAEDGVCP